MAEKTKAQIQQEILALQEQLKVQSKEEKIEEFAKKLNGKFFVDKSKNIGCSKSIHCSLYYFQQFRQTRYTDYDKSHTVSFDGFGFSINSFPCVLTEDWNKAIKTHFGANRAGFSRREFLHSPGITRCEVTIYNDVVSFKDPLVEITESQFLQYLAVYVEANNNMHRDLLRLENIESYGYGTMVSWKDLEDYSEINKLLKSGMTLPEIKQRAKSMIKNLFDSANTLQDLTQYDLHGNDGLNLTIGSGDGGTDYEPYVTHYYVESVNIKWEQILYPTRLQLKCKVFDLVEKLENLKDVYCTGNWDVDYSGQYDVSFHSAKLNKNTLRQVNDLIKANLK